ncbi:MAG: gliding motility-associated C-terminal domain-containing protein [Flavobacteriales bacterium]|nr:gliding motility-associated C-terminal domain-containing protein [Flavobacteriales bacterium]
MLLLEQIPLILMKMMNRFLIVFSFIFSFSQAQSVQKLMYGTNALFGAVNAGTSVPSYMDTIAGTAPADIEGISHVEDNFGDVHFYVTGDGVFNANGNLVAGSGAINSHAGITEIVTCKVPGTVTDYYIVYTKDEGCDLLYYSKINLALNQGQGQIVPVNLNLLLSDTSNSSGLYAEGKEIINKPNSQDKYLIVRRCDFGFEKFDITQLGINNRKTVKVWTPGTVLNPADSGRGELDYHNEYLAYASTESNEMIHFEFNPCTGKSSNLNVFSETFDGIYGVEFSPTAKYLYGSSEKAINTNAGNSNLMRVATGSAINPPNVYKIGTFVDCKGDSVHDVGLGQLELMTSNKIYSPIVGECSILEISDPDNTTINIDYKNTIGDMYKGLSDLTQSDIYISFLDYSAKITPVKCIGESNGKIQLTLAGGMPPYSINWDHNGSNLLSANNLGKGTYKVTISDNSCSGASVVLNFKITEPDSIRSLIEVEDARCYQENGKFKKTIWGGIPPYTVSYSNGFSEHNPRAGFYTMYVVDKYGCQYSDTFRIEEPDNITWSDSISAPLCPGDPGSYHVYNLQGGTGRILINGKEDSVINFLPGNYTVQFVDENGCNRTQSVVIPSADSIISNVVVYQDDCNEFMGRAELTASGGKGELTTEWLGVDPESFHPGKYSVKITDENGCEHYSYFSFTPEPTKLNIPTIFTPNGDGLNEYWAPVFDCEKDFEFEIHTRWGKKLFQSTKDNRKWYGHDPKGILVDDGIYVYILTYYDSRGNSHKEKGTLLVTY